mmetsp:Transcript_9481/g.23804  ORF Transcript_9481/g.23804 Transcript_9481/m.23804 type:complete len:165 (-) Transcript_9481:110-604(-)
MIAPALDPILAGAWMWAFVGTLLMGNCALTHVSKRGSGSASGVGAGRGCKGKGGFVEKMSARLTSAIGGSMDVEVGETFVNRCASGKGNSGRASERRARDEASPDDQSLIIEDGDERTRVAACNSRAVDMSPVGRSGPRAGATVVSDGPSDGAITFKRFELDVH